MGGQLRADFEDLLEEHGLLVFGDVLESGGGLPDVGVHGGLTDERVEIELSFRGFLPLTLLLQHIVDVVGTFRMSAHAGQGGQRDGIRVAAAVAAIAR